MNTASGDRRTTRELLARIRTRLQHAHFAARGFDFRAPGERPALLADELHAIRLLAEELDGELA